jgi:hypothetical protein
LAIDRAHNSLAPGTLSLGNATVTGGNINRSPTAYLANPAAERALYDNPRDGGDQDKVMSLLSFGNRGFLSWFPVHGTSIYEVRARGLDRVETELTVCPEQHARELGQQGDGGVFVRGSVFILCHFFNA